MPLASSPRNACCGSLVACLVLMPLPFDCPVILVANSRLDALASLLSYFIYRFLCVCTCEQTWFALPLVFSCTLWFVTNPRHCVLCWLSCLWFPQLFRVVLSCLQSVLETLLFALVRFTVRSDAPRRLFFFRMWVCCVYAILCVCRVLLCERFQNERGNERILDE